MQPTVVVCVGMAFTDLAGKPWQTPVRLIGYGSLIVATAVGTWQTWTGISDILAGDFF